MKTILILATLFGALAFADSKPITIHVNGMVCDFCVQGLRKGFGKVPAVEETKIDLTKHIVQLKLKDGATLSDEEIKKIVEDSAIAVEKIER